MYLREPSVSSIGGHDYGLINLYKDFKFVLCDPVLMTDDAVFCLSQGIIPGLWMPG